MNNVANEFDMPDTSLNVGKALKLRLRHGLSYDMIANQLGCSKTSAYNILKPFEKLVENPEATQAFRENKADILESAQLSLITELLNKDKRKKATLGNVGYVLDKLDGMIRLDRGQSTANIANIHEYRESASQAERDREEIAKLEYELGLDSQQDDLDADWEDGDVSD